MMEEWTRMCCMPECNVFQWGYQLFEALSLDSVPLVFTVYCVPTDMRHLLALSNMLSLRDDSGRGHVLLPELFGFTGLLDRPCQPFTWRTCPLVAIPPRF